MEEIFNKNQIIEFESNKKAFELWKKYVIDEINNEKKNEIKKKIKSLKNSDTYIYEWKELNNIIGDNEEKRNNEKKKTEYDNNYLRENKNSCFEKNEINLNKKRELLKENYINEYEKYIENLSNDAENYFKENQNEACIITYENYINRNINIGYNEGVDFLKYFYSSINLIKENKIIIPKGFYLYELIYPQTVDSFPVLNKLNYYFVKLFINNKWFLVFVNLTLPHNNKNEIISCYSLNKNELWCFIIMKALYKCFHIFYFSNYQFYIIEMLSGLKYIKILYNINKIIDNYKNNYIQCILLSEHNENNNLNISSNTTAIKEELIKSKSSANKKCDCNKENSNYFYFLICSYEEEYLRIKCEHVKPYNFINFSDNSINKKKNGIQRGYKYINNQGNIIISNAELIPISKFSNQDNSNGNLDGNSDDNSDDNSDTTKNTLCGKNKYGHRNNEIIPSRKYNININENIPSIIQLFKEIIASDPKNSKQIKHDKDCEKNSKNINLKQSKKNHKDIYNWFNESDIEKILEKINITYSSDYLIKIDDFIKKEKVLYFVNRNKFSTLSVSEFIKNRMDKSDTLHKNNKSDKIKKKDKSCSNSFLQLNNCSYLILICSISIKNNKKEIKETKNCEENKLHTEYKTKENYENIKELNENNNIRTNKYKSNEKNNEQNNEKNIKKNNDLYEFYLSFFPYKKKKKTKVKKKKLKNKLFHYFNDCEKIKEKLSSIKLKYEEQKKRKKKKVIFAKDIFECECFFKQICEKDYNKDKAPFFYFNNFIYELLSNKYKNYIFSKKISKKCMLLKENREHFFFLYIKNYNHNNFSIEWIHEKNNEEKSINCTFITIEEFLEKKIKMHTSILKKSIVLKKETLNKVLFKFIINLSLENYTNTFFYLIYKINNLKLLPHLYLYICNIETSKTYYNKEKDAKKKKYSKNMKTTEENFNIIGKFYKFSFEELFLKINLPDNKSECKYLILVVSRKLENIYEKNLNFEFAVALLPNNLIDSNEKNVDKKKNYIQINELLSFCKSYTIKGSNSIRETDIINSNDNSFNTFSTKLTKKDNEENIKYEKKKNNTFSNQKSSDTNNKDDLNDTKFKNELNKHIIKKDDNNNNNNDYYNNISSNNDNDNNNKTIKIIKKIVINSKNNFINGSIFVELKNYYLFKNISVKIIKVKKKKITDDDYVNLDFILKKWEREIILKKVKKKNVFFKNVKLLTDESYFIYMEILKKGINLEELKKNGNYMYHDEKNNCYFNLINFQMNNFPDIILNVFLNFSDEISLISDPSNEELEKDMKKYIEINKINIDEVKKSLLHNRINNIFDLKNELLLNFKKNYKNIFISALNEKEQKMKSNNIIYSDTHNSSHDDHNNINNDHSNDINNEIHKENNETNKDYDYVNKNISKNYNINNNEYNFSQNINKEEKTLYKEDFYNIFLKFSNFDKEYFDYLFSKFFEQNTDKIHMSKFIEIFESLNNENNYLKLEKFENFEKHPIALFPDDKLKNENDKKSGKVKFINKDFDISFENLFSYSSNTKNIIDDTIFDCNIKNKTDILKIKMDAELQLSEKHICLFSNTNNFTDIVKNNYLCLQKIKKKKDSIFASEIKNIINNNKFNALPKERNINFNSENSNISKKETERETKSKLFKSVKIEPSITNIQDLINVVKKIDKSLELCDAKNMKMNVSKIIKERKLFIENIKNIIKNKKLKNLNSQELKDLHKKALELNLETYISDIMENIENQYIALDILNSIKCLFKHNELKKKKITNNEINVEEILTDKNLFLELFQKYSNLIESYEDIQLNDYYKNIFKDSQQTFNKILNNSTCKNADA